MRPVIVASVGGIADAHRDNGKRFVARADEKLGAFVEFESPSFRSSGIDTREKTTTSTQPMND